MTCRRLLLLGVSVASLNAALLSSASAATCVTDVNTGFTNVVSGVAGAPGITVVSAVTPTFSNAVTGVQTTPGSFLTGASLSTTSTNVVNGVSGQTGTALTGLVPTFGNALTGVQTTTTQGSFLTGATLTTASGNAVTNVTATTNPSRGRQQCHDRQRARVQPWRLVFPKWGVRQRDGHDPSRHLSKRAQALR